MWILAAAEHAAVSAVIYIGFKRSFICLLDFLMNSRSASCIVTYHSQNSMRTSGSSSSYNNVDLKDFKSRACITHWSTWLHTSGLLEALLVHLDLKLMQKCADFLQLSPTLVSQSFLNHRNTFIRIPCWKYGSNALFFVIYFSIYQQKQQLPA
jgi:hypothetical protein